MQKFQCVFYKKITKADALAIEKKIIELVIHKTPSPINIYTFCLFLVKQNMLFDNFT